jgi:thiol:disulfide interchange protein DsbD
MLQRFLLLFLCTGLAGQMSAQLSPVNWSFGKASLNNQEVDLTITANIDDGWYVYSQFLEDGGPVPTSITFESEGVELIGKSTEKSEHRKEGYDDIFEMNLIKFGKKVDFVQKLKVPAGTKSIKGFVTFMTCNNESCLPPKDVDFEIVLK